MIRRVVWGGCAAKHRTAPRSDLISNSSSLPVWIRLRAEYLAARVLLGIFGALPRRASLCLAQGLAALAYRSLGHLRRTATRNLNLAFPHWTSEQTREVIRGVFRNFGRLLVEFARLPKLDRENISEVVVYDGFDHFAESLRRGNGTLFLTAHYGAWELCPFAHALYGHPLKFVVRPIDNPYLDRLVNAYRTASGNQVIRKKDSLREMLKTLKRNEGVGILIDQNTTRDAGVFVDFFGRPACTTTVLAALALRTGATVVPGVLIWTAPGRFIDYALSRRSRWFKRATGVPTSWKIRPASTKSWKPWSSNTRISGSGSTAAGRPVHRGRYRLTMQWLVASDW